VRGGLKTHRITTIDFVSTPVRHDPLDPFIVAAAELLRSTCVLAGALYCSRRGRNVIAVRSLALLLHRNSAV